MPGIAAAKVFDLPSAGTLPRFLLVSTLVVALTLGVIVFAPTIFRPSWRVKVLHNGLFRVVSIVVATAAIALYVVSLRLSLIGAFKRPSGLTTALLVMLAALPVIVYFMEISESANSKTRNGRLLIYLLAACALTLGYFGFRGLDRAPTKHVRRPVHHHHSVILKSVRAIEAELHGIPQDGIAIGSPKAKVTMLVFAEPQCPVCRYWSLAIFPPILRLFVRTGKLRVLYEGQAYLGADSMPLLELAEAAGFQNKLWNVGELIYANQGEEGSGYGTLAYRQAIARGITGLDAQKAFAVSKTRAVQPLIETADHLATTSFKDFGTPSFILGPTGSSPTWKSGGLASLQSFVKAIKAALRK